MKLKDLTKEQAIEIAKILYDNPEWVRSDYSFHYQPYDKTWYEDAKEYIRVEWSGITFGETIDKLIMEIDVNFNVSFYYSRNNGLQSLPTHNQHKIHRQLIRWNCEPDNVSRDELRNDQLEHIFKK